MTDLTRWRFPPPLRWRRLLLAPRPPAPPTRSRSVQPGADGAGAPAGKMLLAARTLARRRQRQGRPLGRPVEIIFYDDQSNPSRAGITPS